jgi:hypothetical protein
VRMRSESMDTYIYSAQQVPAQCWMKIKRLTEPEYPKSPTATNHSLLLADRNDPRYPSPYITHTPLRSLLNSSALYRESARQNKERKASMQAKMVGGLSEGFSEEWKVALRMDLLIKYCRRPKISVF